MEIHLGSAASGQPVAWTDADNLHIAVLGRSGSGKSYFLRGIIEQAAKSGALCLVLDYSSDFSNFSPPNSTSFFHADVSSPGFSLNPLAGNRSAMVVAQQLLSALHGVFRMGSRANVALLRATIEYLERSSKPTLAGLLSEIREGSEKSTGLAAATEPLELLSSLIRCGDEPIGVDLSRTGIVVLGFAQIFDAKLRTLLVELVLQTVWNEWLSAGYGSSRPLILVLDECQNLSWEVNSMTIHILREGRKFGIGGWFASQWVANKDAAAALGQAALQVNFRPDDTNIPALAKRLAHDNTGQLAQWQKMLQRLQRGHFILSNSGGKALVVQVPSRPA